MPTTIKPIKLWRRELQNRPGALAQALEPLASARTDLRLVMAYRFPGNESRAAVELFPVAGKKDSQAAAKAGLSEAGLPALLVEGDNKPGAGHAITSALGLAGINLDFLVAQVVGKRYSLVLGFDSEADRKRAAALIKRAAPIIGKIARK
jgi:hypothetical protein